MIDQIYDRDYQAGRQVMNEAMGKLFSKIVRSKPARPAAQSAAAKTSARHRQVGLA